MECFAGNGRSAGGVAVGRQERNRSDNRSLAVAARNGCGAVSGSLFPCSQHPPEQNQLTDVIRVVVRHLKRFPQQSLSFAMRQRREQVGFRVGHKFTHRFQIPPESIQTITPSRITRGLRILWPVPGGPLRRNVFRVAAELEHVPLRDAKVFDDLPGTVLCALRSHPPKLWRQVGNGGFEIRVSAMAGEKPVKFGAKLVI